MNYLKILILGFVVLLTACSEKNYTIEDFDNNDELRNSFVKKCENGELDYRSLNCVNALSSDLIKANIEATKNFPSLTD